MSHAVKDMSGTVRHIVRGIQTPPLVSASVVAEIKDWHWFCHSLVTSTTPTTSCKLNILETVWIKDARPSAWFFTSHRGVVVRKSRRGTNKDSIRKEFFDIADSYGSKNIAIAHTGQRYSVLDRKAFKALYKTAGGLGTVQALSAYIPLRGSEHTATRRYCNYQIVYEILPSGRFQSVVYKLGAPVGTTAGPTSPRIGDDIGVGGGGGEDWLETTDQYQRGRTRSAATSINRVLNDMLAGAIAFVENSRGVRIVKMTSFFVVDPDGVPWLVHTGKLQVVPFTPEHTIDSHLPLERHNHSQIGFFDEQDTMKDLRVNQNGGIDMSPMQTVGGRAMQREVKERAKRKREKLKSMSTRRQKEAMRDRHVDSLGPADLKALGDAANLGTSQSLSCNGDFCNHTFDIDLIAAKTEAGGNTSYDLFLANQDDAYGVSSNSDETKKTFSKPKHKLSFNVIAQARAEKTLVQLMLNRLERGETGDYLTEDYYSDIVAGVGKTFPANYYRKVPVCENCYIMYNKISHQREVAVEKAQLAQQKKKHMKSNRSRKSPKKLMKRKEVMLKSDRGTSQNIIGVEDESKGGFPIAEDVSKYKNKSIVDKNDGETEETLALQQAEAAIDKLNIADIHSLRSYKKPPKSVCNVVSAIFLLLTGEELSWPEARKQLANGERFLELILSVDKDDSIPDARMARLLKIVQNPTFRPDVVSRSSEVAAKFCEWLLGMIQYASWKNDSERSVGGLVELDKLSRRSKIGSRNSNSNSTRLPDIKNIPIAGVSRSNLRSLSENRKNNIIESSIESSTVEDLVFKELTPEELKKIEWFKRALKRRSITFKALMESTGVRKSTSLSTSLSYENLKQGFDGVGIRVAKKETRALYEYLQSSSKKGIVSGGIIRKILFPKIQQNTAPMKTHNTKSQVREMRMNEPSPPAVSKYMKKTFEGAKVGFGVSGLRDSDAKFSNEIFKDNTTDEKGNTYTKREQRNRKRQQEKYTKHLHDPYNMSGGGTKQMQKFKLSDGAEMPYQVIGNADTDLRHICFVVLQDMFDTYEKVQVLFRALVGRHMGVQVLLCNFPGQAHTTLPKNKEKMLNNEYMAAKLHELLQGLEEEGEFYSRSRPFHLVGFGSGSSVGTYFASVYGKKIEYAQSLRSLVNINGYSHIDNQLAAIMHSAINVFSCFPPDRPDLPVSYFSRFLFSDDYLDRVDKNMALNLYTAIMNPITLDGRIRLLRGALHNIDMRGSGVKGVNVPIVLVQSTQNALVSSSHVDAFVEGRSVRHVWAHEQKKTPNLSIKSKQLVQIAVGPPLRAGTANNVHSAIVLWLKSGHEVTQEQKTKVLDLLEVLATSDREMDAATLRAKQKIKEESSLSNKDIESTQSIDSSSGGNVYISGKMPEPEYGETKDISNAYERELAVYKRTANVDRLLGIDSFTADKDSTSIDESSLQTESFEGGTGAKGSDLAGELQQRIEQRLLDFDSKQQKQREEEAKQVEADMQRLKRGQEERRRQWEEDDKGKMQVLQNELEIRKLEREKEELLRTKRLGLIKSGGSPTVELKGDVDKDGTVILSDASKDGPKLMRSSVYAVPEEVDENAVGLSADNLFAEQENQENLIRESESRRQEELEKRVREREAQIAEYAKTQAEMKEAEQARQRQIAERKAAKLLAAQKAASILIQALGRRILAMKVVRERKDDKEMEEVYAIACLQMQSAMRMVLAKARTREIRIQREKTRASYTIAGEAQRFYRGWAGRANAQERREDRAVCLIQRTGRGMIGRILASKEAKRQEGLLLESKSAKKIQALFRMHKGMLIYQQRFVEDLGAVSIQKAYRGVLGRRKAMRKRRWQKAEPGPERLQLGLQLIEDSKEEFEKHRQEIEQLHRSQEKAEQKVSLIHAGLKESEKELAILEKELREIDQLDRDLKQLTHERELYSNDTKKTGDKMKDEKKTSSVILDEEGEAEASKNAAETYALEMAIHLKRAERERKKKELEAEFSGVFAEVTQKREQLGTLERNIAEMEMNRQRKDREFQRLQRKLMELLEEQKLELDNLRAKGVELEVATATSAAAAAATASSAKKHEEKTKAIFSGTEELLKFQFMSMSLGYFNSLNMLKSLKDMNADTTASAMKSSADTAAAAAAAAAAANIPSMKHLGIGADELVSAMSQKRIMNAAAKKKEIEDAKKAMQESFPDDVHIWKVRDVVRWLDLQMLGQYKKAFKEAAVDGDFLMELTPEDMRDILGIEHRLHVKKIITMRERLKPLTAAEIRQRNELQREEHASQLRSMGAGASAMHRISETKSSSGEPPPTLTTLFMHVRNGRKNKVETGIGRGFDVNTEDGHGNTLLITAAQQVNIPMCEMLIDRGAKINHQNLQGNTALHYAMAYDPTGDVGEFLIAKGADDTTENQWGLSPYDGISDDM